MSALDKIPHAVLRSEWQRENGVIRCAMVCECHYEARGAGWAQAGAAYDDHLTERIAAGEEVDYNPRDFDGDPVDAWDAWAKSVLAEDEPAEERQHCGCPVALNGHEDTCPTALAGIRFAPRAGGGL